MSKQDQTSAKALEQVRDLAMAESALGFSVVRPGGFKFSEKAMFESGFRLGWARHQALLAQSAGQPVTGRQTLARLEGNWHKILYMIMRKLACNHVTLGEADLAGAEKSGSSLLVQEGRNGDGLLHFELISDAMAAKLAPQQDVPGEPQR